VNYVDFVSVIDIVNDYKDGIFHPESLQTSDWKMYPVKLSLTMFELYRMHEQHGETHQKDGFIIREDLEIWFIQSGKEFVIEDIVNMYKPMAKHYYDYVYDEERFCFRNMDSDQSEHQDPRDAAEISEIKPVTITDLALAIGEDNINTMQCADATKPDNRA